MNPTVEALKGAGGLAAVASPWWLPVLQTVSQGAALILPILGVVYLVMQMTDWIRKRKQK